MSSPGVCARLHRYLDPRIGSLIRSSRPDEIASLAGPLCFLLEQPAAPSPDASGMIIETEPFGGIVVRWLTFDAWLLVDPTGARLVWRGRVLGRVVVGVA